MVNYIKSNQLDETDWRTYLLLGIQNINLKYKLKKKLDSLGGRATLEESRNQVLEWIDWKYEQSNMYELWTKFKPYKGECMEDLIERFDMIIEQISGIDDAIHNQRFLKGLPKNMQNTIKTSYNPDDLSTSRFLGSVLKAYGRTYIPNFKKRQSYWSPNEKKKPGFKKRKHYENMTHKQRRNFAAKSKCFRCRRKGHMSYQCRELRDINGHRIRDEESRKVHELKKKVYEERPTNIFKNNKNKNNSYVYFFSCSVFKNISKNKSQQLIKIPIKMNNEKIFAPLDCGSTITIISSKLRKKLNLQVIEMNTSLTLITANGNRTTNKWNLVKTNIEYNQRIIPVELLELDIDEPMLIGLDLFDKLGLYIGGIRPSFETKGENNIHVSRVKPYNEEDAYNNQIIREFEYQMFKVVDDNVKSTRGKFCQLDIAVVPLDTGDARPIYINQYKIADVYKPLLRNYIKEMMEKGVLRIHRGRGRWNFPMISAYKKPPDNQPNLIVRRHCLDVRMLNKILKSRVVKTPLIKDILNDVSSYKIYSIIDLESAYDSCPIRRQDREKLVFTFENVRYEYIGACFGIKTMPAIFQNIMNVILSPCKEFARWYIDDIIIFSNSIEEHNEHVLKIIEILTKNNFTIKKNKSKFGLKKIRLLGHTVSASGIEVDYTRIQNLESLKRPVSAKGVRSILGLFNYLRDYIPHYSRICSSLEKLRYTKGKFSWSKENELAFQTVKKILKHSPVLEKMREDVMLQVATDASKFGISCVLFQEYGGRRHYIGFKSRAVKQSEANYPINKLELLAIVYGLQTWYQFLWGREFILWCDHRCFQDILNSKKINPLVNRWIMIIFSFNFDIRNIRGIKNIFPDLLSRIYEDFESNTNQSIPFNDYGNESLEVITKFIKSQEAPLKSSLTEKKIHMRIQMLQSSENDKLKAVAINRIKELSKAHTGAHYGVNHTLENLKREGISWSNISQDVELYIDSCKTCRKWRKKKIVYNFLKSVHAELPMDHIVYDIAGPMKRTQREKEYILVIVDVCTRYCWLYALERDSSDEIAQCLIDLVSKFGLFKKIGSDRSTKLTGGVIKDFKRLFKIQEDIIAPYNPSANGLAESHVKICKNIIYKICDKLENWDQYLKCCNYYMNTRYMKLTDCSPQEMMLVEYVINLRITLELRLQQKK